MSKTKHTPGPWYYNGDEGSETGKFGHNVNTARGVIADIAECGAATEHNARLIAAAPQTLKERDAYLKAVKAVASGKYDAETLIDLAHAALRQAKGE